MSYVYVAGIDGCGCRSSDGLGASGSGCPDYLRDLSKMLQENKAGAFAAQQLCTHLGTALTATVLLSGIGIPLVATGALFRLLMSDCNAEAAITEEAKVIRTWTDVSTIGLDLVGVALAIGIVTLPLSGEMLLISAVLKVVKEICNSIVEKKAPSVAAIAALSLSFVPLAATPVDEASIKSKTDALKNIANNDSLKKVVSESGELKRETRKAREAAYKAMSVPEKIAYQKKVIKTLESVNNYPVKGQYDNQIRIAKKEIEALEKPDAKAAAKEAEKKRKEELAKGIESATTRGKAAGSTQAIKDQAAKEAQAYAAALKSKKSSVALPLAAAGAGFLALGPVGAAAGAGAGLIFSALSRSKKSSK